jgi:hypothetical protein
MHSLRWSLSGIATTVSNASAVTAHQTGRLQAALSLPWTYLTVTAIVARLFDNLINGDGVACTDNDPGIVGQ